MAQARSRLPGRQHLTRGGRPRRRRLSQHPRSRFSHARSVPHVSRAGHRSRRPPKPNAPGCDLDPRRRFPARAAAHEDPELSLSVWPTYRCSAAKARGSAERERRPSSVATPCWPAATECDGALANHRQSAWSSSTRTRPSIGAGRRLPLRTQVGPRSAHAGLSRVETARW